MKQTIPPRLRWACRRGMLELDLLLSYFLDNVYLSLSEAEQQLFHQLLESQDQDLFRWLISKETSPPTELTPLIEKMRLHAKSRL